MPQNAENVVRENKISKIATLAGHSQEREFLFLRLVNPRLVRNRQVQEDHPEVLICHDRPGRGKRLLKSV